MLYSESVMRFLELGLPYSMLFVPVIWPSVRFPEEATPKNTFSKKFVSLHPEVPGLLPLMKTRDEFAKEAFDVADAIVVARAAAAERRVNV